MMYIIIFFSFWFVISLLYAFRRISLGKLGKWLHRYGWINEWSMFTGQGINATVYRILFYDFKTDDEIKEWKIIDLNQIKCSGPILNPNFKLNFFVGKCIKKMYAQNRLNGKSKINQDAFDYLCAVLIQLPNNNKAKSRKIKIEKQTIENHWVESICSKTFELQ